MCELEGNGTMDRLMNSQGLDSPQLLRPMEALPHQLPILLIFQQIQQSNYKNVKEIKIWLICCLFFYCYNIEKISLLYCQYKTVHPTKILISHVPPVMEIFRFRDKENITEKHVVDGQRNKQCAHPYTMAGMRSSPVNKSIIGLKVSCGNKDCSLVDTKL